MFVPYNLYQFLNIYLAQSSSGKNIAPVCEAFSQKKSQFLSVYQQNMVHFTEAEAVDFSILYANYSFNRNLPSLIETNFTV